MLRYAAKDHDLLIQRLKALKALRTGKPVVVIAPVSAAIKKITPHRFFEETSLKIQLGDEIEIAEINKRLAKLGYERMEIVDARGGYSIRGGIVDAFMPDAEYPYRIEFFGSEADSIRTFDTESQRSVENLKFVEIYPAEQIITDEDVFKKALKKLRSEYTRAAKEMAKKDEETAQNLMNTCEEICEYIEQVSNLQFSENYIRYFYDETEYLWDYMTDGMLMIDDPDRIEEMLSHRTLELKEDFKVLLARGQAISKDISVISDENDFRTAYKYPNVAVFTPFPKRIAGAETFDQVYNLQ